MGADFHILIFEGLTEKDLEIFFSNTMSSKYFSPKTIAESRKLGYDKVNIRVLKTPSVFIGEISWLKANLLLFHNERDFVPNTVSEVNDLIEERLPNIDDKLIDKIDKAFDLENITGYTLGNRKEVIDFLKQHIGKRCFTVNW